MSAPETRHLAPDTCSRPDTRNLTPDTSYYLGIDIGRRHDRTVFWVDEVQVSGSGFQVPASLPDTRHLTPDTLAVADRRLAVATLVRTLENTPFDEQLSIARELLSLTVAAPPLSPLLSEEGKREARGGGRPFLIRRACIDSTGIGAHMAETLQKEFGPRVEPVHFTAAVKEDLAFRTRRGMEARSTLLPDTREIRRAFSAVKKYVTPGGNFRFDAARTEAGHADEFWAKALADLAADPEAHASISRASDAFIVDAAPLVEPAAFGQIDSRWSAFAW